MNEPIISPLFIYLLSLVDNTIAFLIIIIIALCFSIFMVVVTTELCDEEDKLIFKRLTITLFIFILLFILIPNKETLLSMLVSKYITIDNIVKGKELIQNSVDYIVNAIK